MPVCIHNRDSIGDCLEILKENKHLLEFGGVIHCFSESIETYKEIKKLGLKIAFGGTLTFKNSIQAPAVCKFADMEDILIETDCPYLTPHPYRGQTNEPKYTSLVAQKIAEIKKLSTDTVRIQGMLRRQTRLNKERAKIVSTKSGEQDILAFMAAFSSLLPENVSVNNFRLNESGVDIVLASEVENLDLARVLKPMSDWKISQLQQRQNRGGSGNTINLKLVPNTGNDVKKGRRR